jgi:hypothetical protein
MKAADVLARINREHREAVTALHAACHHREMDGGIYSNTYPGNSLFSDPATRAVIREIRTWYSAEREKLSEQYGTKVKMWFDLSLDMGK